ncbi:MAG: HAMP domain-containing histidine kinase [Actinomycetia bacterium]|nr:HAMP domain-containing histidine kinase [Actinomycetes bacterium]
MKRQIIWIVSVASGVGIIVGVLVLAIITTVDTRIESERAADRAGKVIAKMLSEGDPSTVPAMIQAVESQDLRFAVVTPQGSFGEPSVTEDSRVIREDLVLRNGSPATVYVAPDPRLVHENVDVFIISEVVLGAIVWAIAVGIGVVVTARMIRPLENLAEVSQQLSEGDLDVRADVTGPEEIQEVAGALNSLAERFNQRIVDEREAAADLSHRLRTPLAALQAEADTLADPQEAARIFEKISRLDRDVDAVITTMRRSERDDASGGDLSGVLAERIAFWTPLLEFEGRECLVQAPDRLPSVAASNGDLSTMLDALIQNVSAHTPEGTNMNVRVVDGPLITLTVADEGPGYPNDDVLARGHSYGGSTGLGLDIVRQIAVRSGGSLRLKDATDHGGAAAVITLGRRP